MILHHIFACLPEINKNELAKGETSFKKSPRTAKSYNFFKRCLRGILFCVLGMYSMYTTYKGCYLYSGIARQSF